MRRSLIGIIAVLFCAAAAQAQKAAPLSALAKMPVREVTVFKDGHAFVLHSGKMPTDPSGNVVLDYLPAPVLGTFWPYSGQKEVKLSGVTASQMKVLVSRTALTLRELIEANVGAAVTVTEAPLAPAAKEAAPLTYAATIVGVPTLSGEELQSISPPGTGQRLPVKGSIVLLRTADGVKVVPIDRIADITFKGEHKAAAANEEFRNLLTLTLDWPDAKAQKEAEVGMVYVQKGIRWIPHYKIAIDGKGSAVVKLQATLLNEMADLEDVTAHLVIGVPTFAFKETLDPLSLQQTAAQLSSYFREDARTAYALSNAIMSQSARMTEVRQPAAADDGGANLGPELAGSGKTEDLFIFTLKHVSLKKGQRMTVPVTEFALPYRDVYSLDIAFTAPPELRRHIGDQRAAEIARLFAAPKVMHKIRLENKSEYPLTTAPAMIVRGDRVLAQGMMTYTAIGASTDLTITTAVDVRVAKTDTETKRTPNATVWQGDTYGRIDLSGKIGLTHYGKQPIEVEVVRHVLGNVTEAGAGGKIEMVNVFEDSTFAPGGDHPAWWGWYSSWPYWWRHFNGVGRVAWTVKLEPGKPVELTYAWNYYWR
jgi:hypothetical protein